MPFPYEGICHNCKGAFYCDYAEDYKDDCPYEQYEDDEIETEEDE